MSRTRSLSENMMLINRPYTDHDICTAAAKGNLVYLDVLRSKINDASDFKRICEAASDGYGWSPLHYAASRGQICTIRYLLDRVSVDANMRDREGNTPLMVAIKNNKGVHVINNLIVRGSNVNIHNQDRATPLHLAVDQRNTAIMNSLVNNGADIEAVRFGMTPLQCASEYAHLGMVEFLLYHKADCDAFSPECLSYPPVVGAIMSKSHECLEALLMASADPNINVYGKTPLAYAALTGDPKLVRSLLRFNANPNLFCTYNLKPIQYAALVRSRTIVAILLPYTESIPSIANWDVNGIIDHYFVQP